MNRASANLVIGIAIGAVAVLLITRVRKVVTDEDPEALADRLTRNLQALEARIAAATEGAVAPAH